MAGKILPKVDYIRKLINYDPHTGLLTWRPRPVAMFTGVAASSKAAEWNARYAGSIATMAEERWSSAGRGGADVVSVGSFLLSPSRVAWAIYHGAWPDKEIQIDHINGIRTDNRITNLRAASKAENARNRKPKREGTSSYLGVCRVKGKGTWSAGIVVNGKRKHLGTFDCEEDAARAYDAAAAEHHGEFARPNFPLS